MTIAYCLLPGVYTSGCSRFQTLLGPSQGAYIRQLEVRENPPPSPLKILCEPISEFSQFPQFLSEFTIRKPDLGSDFGNF